MRCASAGQQSANVARPIVRRMQIVERTALGPYCLPFQGRWQCASTAVCGRPFIIAGEQRLARLSNSSSWTRTLRKQPDVSSLGVEERQRVGDHWTRVALMEHASIAAFARFTLQLLHVGAPRELVDGSQRAMRDETDHAQLAFALASSYSGRPVGPGRLSVDGALVATSLAGVVELVLLEGCLGETFAAFEAAEAAAQCSDASVRIVLRRIAADERRHAELAWRFVAWALGKDPALCQLVGDWLAGLVDEDPAAFDLDLTTNGRLLEYGVVTPQLSAHLAQVAQQGIVVPCGRRLLEWAKRERPRFDGARA